MIEPASPAPQSASQPAREAPWASILTAGAGILAIFVLLSGIAVFLFGAIMAMGSPISVESGEPWIMFSYAAAAGFIILLVTPMVILAIRKLAGMPPPTGILTTRLNAKTIGLLSIIYLLVLGSGFFVDTLPSLYWLTIPALNVLALSLPVVLLFWLGTRDLPPSSPQRNWTTFGLGMILSPLVIMIIELVALFFGLILLIIILAFTIPDFPPTWKNLH